MFLFYLKISESYSQIYCNPSVNSCLCEINTTACGSYIYNVSINNFNNKTTCTNGGYNDYTNLFIPLLKTSTNNITITPAIGNQINNAFVDDEIAIWIDYNNDFDFNDSLEQVGYVLVKPSGWSNFFSFKVPPFAVLGNLRMRVRISNSDLIFGGPIDPCSITSKGEIEDYTIMMSELMIPNGISPNGDGINDVWNITGWEYFNYLKIKLTNVLGQLIFSSDGLYVPWNGRYNDEIIKSGTYFYEVQCGDVYKTGILYIVY
jgi:gliding motility-associated-like protein